jgi:hypothetical protein
MVSRFGIETFAHLAFSTDRYLSSEPGKGYHIFAGKDASKGLGMSSLKPEDAVSDYSSLDEKQLKVLDDWVRVADLCFVFLL